jgi:hypothetical protein
VVSAKLAADAKALAAAEDRWIELEMLKDAALG